MYCYVYKGDRKEDYFLYLNQEFSHDTLADDFPSAVLDLLGDLSLVVEFELDLDRKLPQAEASQVIHDITEQGFYLQMPKKDMRAVEERYFN